MLFRGLQGTLCLHSQAPGSGAHTPERSTCCAAWILCPPSQHLPRHLRPFCHPSCCCVPGTFLPQAPTPLSSS